MKFDFVAGFIVAFAVADAAAGVHNVKLDTSADRVETPLQVNLTRLGTLRPRSAGEIRSSNWTLGCEVLDRDFANFDEYKEYLGPLGIKTIRLQGGWAKCEKEKGRYDFAWLDHIIDTARAGGLNILLETDYGNPIYKGGGGWDLAGSFPTSEEALAAWDAWVGAMARHFKGRVRDWAMWNEPDGSGGPRMKTVEEIAAFNVRTAKIILGIIPDARIAGLSLVNNDPAYLEKCLVAMGEDVNLFHWFIYHGYSTAPEDSYRNVVAQKAVVAKYAPKARLRQGENGCPSEMATKFALSGTPWSEYSQAKWDMRRMLGDLGHGVESSVFTICDFNHAGREINLKGLLRADEAKDVIAVKRAYYAVQNVVSVFDDRWTLVEGSSYDKGFGTHDLTLATYEYVKDSGEPLFLFWVHGAEGAEYTPADAKAFHAAPIRVGGVFLRRFSRPGDSFVTRPAVFRYTGARLKDPVWVDLLTGRVYAYPQAKQIVTKGGVRFLDVPVYDSPCLITERSALTFDR